MSDVEAARKVITAMRASKVRGFSPNLKLLESAEALLAALTTAIHARQEANKQAEKQFRLRADAERQCRETTAKLDAERAARQEAERDAASWKERYLDKKKDFEKQAVNWSNDQAQLTAAEQARAALDRLLANRDTELAEMKAAMTDALDRLDGAEQAREEAERMHDTVERENDDLRAQLTTVEQARAQAEQEREEGTSAFRVSESLRKAYKEQRDTARAQLTEAESLLASLRTALETAIRRWHDESVSLIAARHPRTERQVLSSCRDEILFALSALQARERTTPTAAAPSPQTPPPAQTLDAPAPE